MSYPSVRPENWGLDLPEPLLREMYIVRSDLTPVMGGDDRFDERLGESFVADVSVSS